MKLERYPHFFECCKNSAPNHHIDLQALSDSEKDAFVFSYLRDQEILKEVQDGLAQAKNYQAREELMNDVYQSVEQLILDLCQHYNDWIDIRFETDFATIFQRTNPFQAMEDAGHKHADFC